MAPRTPTRPPKIRQKKKAPPAVALAPFITWTCVTSASFYGLRRSFRFIAMDGGESSAAGMTIAPPAADLNSDAQSTALRS